MVLRTLIRNYFERMGTFDGILQTSIGKEIEKQANGDVIGFCYRMLGYENENPLALVELRQKLRTGEVSPEDFAKVTGRSANSRKEMLKILKMHEVSAKENRKHLMIQGIADLDLLAAEFYANDDGNVLIDNGSQEQFSSWLLSNKIKSVKEVIKMPQVQPCLLSFKTVKDIVPTITNHTMFVPVELTEKMIERINLRALSTAMGKNADKLLSSVKSTEFVFLRDIDLYRYLELLDLAIAEGKTYQEIAKSQGANIPDLLKAWELTGFVFAKMGDSILCVMEDSADWKLFTEQQFILMVTTVNHAGYAVVSGKEELDEIRCF